MSNPEDATTSVTVHHPDQSELGNILAGSENGRIVEVQFQPTSEASDGTVGLINKTLPENPTPQDRAEILANGGNVESITIKPRK